MSNRTRRHGASGTVLLAAALVAMLTITGLAAGRIQPLVAAEWTDTHRALVNAHQPDAAGALDRVAGDLRVFLKHPALVSGVMPFAGYIARDSSLGARHREMLILRTAWLCRSGYYWARHAPRARDAGLSAPEIRRVAAGPDDAAWDPFEAMLLRLADELHVNAFASDATWKALTSRYTLAQTMDAVFTVAELTMLAETVNSIGLDPDTGLTERLPLDVPYRIRVPRTDERLIGKAARVAPLEPAEWSADVRSMLDPSGSGRAIAAVYRTFAQHPKMYTPRQRLSEYIRTQATLDPRTRELLIMRIGALCKSDYEWAAHAPAGRRAGMTEADVRHVLEGPRTGSDTFDDTLLRAVDELHADRVISDATWRQLSSRLNEQQLLDLLITTGGYHMVSMALNTFGVQLEPGGERIPERASTPD